MLNQNLRISELQKSLEKYIDVIDLIQEDILGEQKIPLSNDKKRLGMIHHALNVENYKKVFPVCFRIYIFRIRNPVHRGKLAPQRDSLQSLW